MRVLRCCFGLRIDKYSNSTIFVCNFIAHLALDELSPETLI